VSSRRVADGGVAGAAGGASVQQGPGLRRLRRNNNNSNRDHRSNRAPRVTAHGNDDAFAEDGARVVAAAAASRRASNYFAEAEAGASAGNAAALPLLCTPFAFR